MKNWSVLVWLPLVVGLTLAGCEGESESESTDATTEVGEETATEEGEETATEEGEEIATEEGGEAATEEGGEAATEEGGEAATEEGGEAATEEGGEAATEEGGETVVEEGGEGEASAFTCASIWHCELGCLESDCGCFDGSTGDDDPAVIAYDGLTDCLKSQCPLGEASCIGDEVTFIGECRTEAEVCVPDTAGGTCNDTVNCILVECDVADLGCKETCFSGAKMENHVYGATYAACVEANCDFPYTEECLQKAKDDLCSTQWSACNNSDF